MHYVVYILIAAMVVIMPMSAPASAQEQTVCEVVGCSTECWMIAPGVRRCANRCLRRCRHYYEPPAEEPQFNEEPEQAEAPQEYEAPEQPQEISEPEQHQWEPHYQQASGTPTNPIAAAGFLAIVALIALVAIGLLFDFGGTSSLERDVKDTRALTDKLNAAAREADARIAAFLKKEGIDG